MKKSNKFFFLVLIIIFAACKDNKKPIGKIEEKQDWKKKVIPIIQLRNTEFVGAMENELPQGKNVIYCASLLYAFQELKDHIGQTIQIAGKDKDLTLFANSLSHLQSMPKKEYRTSFTKLPVGFKVTAEFEKSLPFAIVLDSFHDKLKFDSKNVQSFGLNENEHEYEKRKSISVLFYKNDQDFIVGLQPKDTTNEILLYLNKNVVTKDMLSVYREINQKISLGAKDRKSDISSWRAYYMYDDKLIIPVIHFNIEKTYDSLMHKFLSFDHTTTTLELVWQRTAFLLNHEGAKIESVAEVVTAAPAAMEEKKKDDPIPKKLVFDQPFFIILKKKNSSNPYFMAYIKNTELMQLENN